MWSAIFQATYFTARTIYHTYCNILGGTWNTTRQGEKNKKRVHYAPDYFGLNKQ